MHGGIELSIYCLLLIIVRVRLDKKEGKRPRLLAYTDPFINIQQFFTYYAHLYQNDLNSQTIVANHYICDNNIQIFDQFCKVINNNGSNFTYCLMDRTFQKLPNI